jgi:hypothetical protein
VERRSRHRTTEDRDIGLHRILACRGNLKLTAKRGRNHLRVFSDPPEIVEVAMLRRLADVTA